MTNKTETTNKRVRPFYIDCEGLSFAQVVDIVNKSVEAGAIPCVSCFDTVMDKRYPYASAYGTFKFWGVNDYNETYTNDVKWAFGIDAIEIKYEDLDKHLGL